MPVRKRSCYQVSVYSLDGRLYRVRETMATSPEQAENNVRFRLFKRSPEALANFAFVARLLIPPTPPIPSSRQGGLPGTEQFKNAQFL